MRLAPPVVIAAGLAFTAAVAAPVPVCAQIGSSLTAAAPSGAVDVATALRIAFGLPRIAAANAILSRAMVVEAVYQASILSGALTMGQARTTGTLTPGYGGAYRYAPQPSDRLVLHYAGQVHEFVVHEAVGNPQAMTTDAWILSPHRLSYTHRVADQAEAELQIVYDGSAFEVSMRGWTTQWGRRYDMDLHSSGRAAGVLDYDGQDTQTAYALTGTISGSGLVVDVLERHSSSLVAATSLRTLPSQRGTASSSNSTLSSTMTFGGSRYELQNVQIQAGTSSRGGQASAGMTGLSGTVLRDGQPFGTFVAQGGRAFLQTADGLVSMDGM